MTVGELMELLEGIDPGLKVRLVYQPNWPMAVEASFAKEAVGANYHGKEERALYICQNASGGSMYAPGGIYDEDDEDE